MSKISNRFSTQVRERTVRLLGEHWADYGSERAAQTSCGMARLKLLDREANKVRRAILRTGSSYFSQAELDRREKW
jgi:hypothetical protein